MQEFKGKIKLGISPCPNDTFIFGAWINGLIHNQEKDLLINKVEVDYLDIQELNLAGRSNKYDVIKVSAAHVVHLLEDYEILSCGAALGEDCGPLLISKKPIKSKDLSNKKIAIPGELTTANLLFKFAFPQHNLVSYYLFSDIEDAIINEEVEAGVIIHENRFTYTSKGLQLILDLGQYWIKKNKLAIPLGLIMVRKNLSKALKKEIKKSIQASLAFAEENDLILLPYIQSHAQEMEADIIHQHIKLYVNKYSKSLGKKGKLACIRLFKHADPGFNPDEVVFV